MQGFLGPFFFLKKNQAAIADASKAMKSHPQQLVSGTKTSNKEK